MKIKSIETKLWRKKGLKLCIAYMRYIDENIAKLKGFFGALYGTNHIGAR